MSKVWSTDVRRDRVRITHGRRWPNLMLRAEIKATIFFEKPERAEKDLELGEYEP